MMTALLILVSLDLVATIVVIGLLVLRKAPAPVDPAAVARAILRTPFDAAEVRDAMELADTVSPPRSSVKAQTHYVVQHTIEGVTRPLYDGYDSDKAYAAHLEMERNPDRYPGRHQYLENGRARVDRYHHEIGH